MPILILLTILTPELYASQPSPTPAVAKEIQFKKITGDEPESEGNIGSAMLRAGRRQLEDWIHIRRMRLIDTMEVEREELKKSPLAFTESEIKKYFEGFEKNSNREEKACFLSRLTLQTSELAVVLGLKNLGIWSRPLKRRFSKDQILDAAGTRIRDYLVENYRDTKCGKAQAFGRLDRLNLIECDLTLERAEEQIKDATDMLEMGKLSPEEVALVQLNLGLQYTYAFYIAPKGKAEFYRRAAMNAYRKISEIFPETRQLTKACVDGLATETARDLGSCADIC